jgi:uncharacterized membrane protein HdeD (DUF308 family)
MIASMPVSGLVGRYWWLFLIRGLVALALGVFALMYPGAALAGAVLLIGAFLFVDGIVALAKAVQIMRSDAHWWVLLLEGIAGIAAGIVIFMWPGISLLSLAYVIGYWAIISGAFAIGSAVRLRTHVPGEWLYLLFAVISIVFGIFVLAAPAIGLVYIALMISFYGFVSGVTMIALAFSARRRAT